MVAGVSFMKKCKKKENKIKDCRIAKRGGNVKPKWKVIDRNQLNNLLISSLINNKK